MTSEPVRQLGRRERSKLRVRHAIYSSALALFEEQGYVGTTIDQITERADVARGTFFNYFQRKEDLITAWAQNRSHRLRSEIDRWVDCADGDVTVHLERCMATLTHFNEQEGDLTPVMLEAWVKSGLPLVEEPYTADTFTAIIELGKRNGSIASEVDARHVGQILRDCYLGTLYRWSQKCEDASALHAELLAMLHVILTGILSNSPSRQS